MERSLVALAAPEVLLLLLQLSLDQSLGEVTCVKRESCGESQGLVYLLHDVLGEHGHLLGAWHPGSLGGITNEYEAAEVR